MLDNCVTRLLVRAVPITVAVLNSTISANGRAWVSVSIGSLANLPPPSNGALVVVLNIAAGSGVIATSNAIWDSTSTQVTQAYARMRVIFCLTLVRCAVD